jgi:hypothetical protein
MENDEIKRRILDLELKLSEVEKAIKAATASGGNDEDLKKMRGQIEGLEKTIADLDAKLTAAPAPVPAKKESEQDDPFLI